MLISRHMFICLVFDYHHPLLYSSSLTCTILELITASFDYIYEKMTQKKQLTKKQQHENILANLVLFPAVAVLPMHMQNKQKVFFNPYIEAFCAALATRGSKDNNGITFVQDKFIHEFCDEQHLDLTPEEREQYHLVIGYVSFCISFPFQRANVTLQQLIYI